MSELKISPNFTTDDIHKIREYHYQITKNMTLEERNSYYQKGADEALEIMAKLKKEKEFVTH